MIFRTLNFYKHLNSPSPYIFHTHNCHSIWELQKIIIFIFLTIWPELKLRFGIEGFL